MSLWGPSPVRGISGGGVEYPNGVAKDHEENDAGTLETLYIQAQDVAQRVDCFEQMYSESGDEKSMEDEIQSDMVGGKSRF